MESNKATNTQGVTEYEIRKKKRETLKSKNTRISKKKITIHLN